jgi:ubiquinone/menaquinone biosynthesis C-methylase UbiE
VLDVQQVMLDHTLRRVRAAGLDNVRARCADAARLPYVDASFDAAFMMTVLGEIPDGDTALADLRRVLRPGGRLVVGEFLLDWHAVPLGVLRRRACRRGLRLERRVGSRMSYLARFTAA